jgi:fructose-1-phosphate kinase PfkB-like protein
MIYTVTVNPCLDEDKYFQQDKLEIGTNRAVRSEKYPGGKGIDVSRAIHASGSRSVATGFIGGHIGELVLGGLGIEGIICDFVEITTETRTNVMCHLSNSREIRINSTGPTISYKNYNELLRKIRGFNRPTAGFVCGSVCGGMEPIHSYDLILHAFKQHGEQCITFLDTGEKHTMGALDGVSPPDFIKPNIYEFHRLLKVKVNAQGISSEGRGQSDVNEEYLIKKYCSPHKELPLAWKILVERLVDFAKKYPKVHVLLSVSQFGALALDKDRNEVVHSFYCGPVEINTLVGAGDSFLGGFVTSYVERNKGNIEMALRAGVATAVARLQGQHRDFGYIDQEKLQEVINSSELKVNRFSVTETAKYVEENLFACFPICQANKREPGETLNGIVK